MAKHLPLTLTLIILTSLVSCLPGSGRISQTWFYTYAKEVTNISDSNWQLTPAHFIDLNENGEYSANLVKYESGIWKKEGKTITLTNSKKESIQFLVKAKSSKEMELEFTLPDKTKANLIFTGFPQHYKEATLSPFSAINNQWRIKATHKETEQELTLRLKNLFRYWERYFSWGLDAKIDMLDVRSLKGPIKMYGNGFTVIPFNELSASWKQLFFDEDDCQKSWNQLDKLVSDRSITWPKTDNRFKGFISVFQQLQQNLK